MLTFPFHATFSRTFVRLANNESNNHTKEKKKDNFFWLESSINRSVKPASLGKWDWSFPSASAGRRDFLSILLL